MRPIFEALKFARLPPAEMSLRAREFYAEMDQRRTTRHFSTEPALKARMREAAEREEHENYHGRMPPEWLEALAPLGTDEHKAHITDAPWVVVVFKESFQALPDRRRAKNYYVDESVGIACGLFIAAVHHMGLCTLTHTPSPMGFLSELLRRPDNEKPYLLMPVGFPAAQAQVPAIRRKSLEQILQWNLG